MKTVTRNIVLILAAMVTILAGSLQAQDVDNDIDLDDGVLRIEGDWTIDVVQIFVDDDEIVVSIKQYLSQEDFLADDPVEERTRDYDEEDVMFIDVALFEGDDRINTALDTEYIELTNRISMDVLCGSGDDHVSGSIQGYMQVWAGDGDDYVQGYGGIGAFVSGGSGDDYIIGSYSDDFILGGEGNDFLRGSLGSDFVDGGAGDDVVIGGWMFNFSTNAKRGDGLDTLLGGDGDDMLFGTYDNHRDIMVGGEGADTFWNRFYTRSYYTMNTRGGSNSLAYLTNERPYSTRTLELEDVQDFTLSEGDVFRSLRQQ